MKLQEIIKNILREGSENGGGIFYHNSDYEIDNFIPQTKKDISKSNYLFFSNEPNTFIDRKYTYKVQLLFDPERIFNPFNHITKYGLTCNIHEYKDEILDMFEKNTDYFINEWEKKRVDRIGEVMVYFVDEGNDKNDLVGLLYYFLTKWNDSWAIIETNIFLNFLDSKGFNGFVTQEEGLINIACNNFKSIKIIEKRNMW